MKDKRWSEFNVIQKILTVIIIIITVVLCLFALGSFIFIFGGQ